MFILHEKYKQDTHDCSQQMKMRAFSVLNLIEIMMMVFCKGLDNGISRGKHCGD